jgi:hypothetical protein
VVAKVAAVEADLLPASARFEGMNRFLTVDRFCLAGGIFFAIGFVIAAFATLYWMATGFGDLNAAVNIRLAAYATLGMALGVQSVTAGFLLGLVRTHRRRMNGALPSIHTAELPGKEIPTRTDAAA